MRFKSNYFLLVPIALSMNNALAEIDIAAGEAIHDKNCISCHTNMHQGVPSKMYTRANHKVKNYNALWMQVQRCEQNLGLQLFDDDIDNITTYLNKNFYHFDKK